MAVMFHGQILSGYQKTEYAEKYGRSHQKAGYPVEEPEEPLKHTMATAAHTGDMPRVYI